MEDVGGGVPWRGVQGRGHFDDRELRRDVVQLVGGEVFEHRAQLIASQAVEQGAAFVVVEFAQEVGLVGRVEGDQQSQRAGPVSRAETRRDIPQPPADRVPASPMLRLRVVVCCDATPRAGQSRGPAAKPRRAGGRYDCEGRGVTPRTDGRRP